MVPLPTDHTLSVCTVHCASLRPSDITGRYATHLVQRQVVGRYDDESKSVLTDNDESVVPADRSTV